MYLTLTFIFICCISITGTWVYLDMPKDIYGHYKHIRKWEPQLSGLSAFWLALVREIDLFIIGYTVLWGMSIYVTIFLYQLIK